MPHANRCGRQTRRNESAGLPSGGVARRVVCPRRLLQYKSKMTDWTSIREQFPVTRRFAYLNSAGAGPVSIRSHAAATDYYQKMMNDGDVHWFRWLDQREAIRARIAKFINADPEEIAFTTNTSSGMNVIGDALAERGEVIS